MTAALALDLARRAGLRVLVDGANLVLDGPTEPSPEVVEALRAHKAEIIHLFTTVRCRTCRGPATLNEPLLDCAYAGRWLQLHRRCIDRFMAEAATSERFAPSQDPVCDVCGKSGGRRITYLGAPIGGVPVHLRCVTEFFSRLDAIP